MSDIRIVQQREVGYSKRGDTVYSAESYIKVLTSFKSGALRMLKGAPLSIFICVALHEADEDPGASLSTMERETGYSRPSVIEASRFLTDPAHHFIEETGREADGTKRYRVAAYAWFGEKRGSSIPQFSPTEPAVNADKPAKNTKGRGSKKTLPPPLKVFTPPPHDDDVSTSTPDSRDKHHHHDVAAARKIFAEVGFQGKNLQILAERVPEEIAREWADWIPRAKQIPHRYIRPYGYAWTVLESDPHAHPPIIADADLPESPLELPDADTFGNGPAGELWRDVISDMCAATNRATMHQLIESRVLDYDCSDNTIALTVSDPSGYLLNRLTVALQRTVTGITGKKCNLVVVADRGDAAISPPNRE